MASRLLRTAAFLALLVVLGGLAYWVWRQGRTERKQEAGHQAAIEAPSRRIVNPKTQEVVIQLGPEGRKQLGLIAEAPKRVKWQKTARLLGLTVTVPYRQAEVRSPWTGVLEAPSKESMPIVGQKMSRGQLVANLRVEWNPTDRLSLENQLRNIRGTISETEAQLGVANNSVERLRQIGEQVVADKLLIGAKGTSAQFQARLSALQAQEKDLQEALAKQSTEFRFRLVAPQSGQLTSLVSRPGEVVAAGSLVATIYDPQELWVSVLVLPSQLPLSEIPDQAQITLPGFEHRPLSASLVRVKTGTTPLQPSATGPLQQGVEVIYRAINPRGLLPVGLQAEAIIHVGPPQEVVEVPESAVLQWNNRRLIYIQRGPEEFVKQFVDVEGEENGTVYVRPTLPEGSHVVIKGAQDLLSEEYKQAIQIAD